MSDDPEKVYDPEPDDIPTRRESGGFGIFEQACRDAIEGLVALGVASLSTDDPGHKLLAEARTLVTFFQTWKVRAPASEERVEAIQRALDLHRAVAEYLVGRRHDVIG